MVPQRTEWSVWGRGAVKEKEQLPLAGREKVELQGPPKQSSFAPNPSKAQRLGTLTLAFIQEPGAASLSWSLPATTPMGPHSGETCPSSAPHNSPPQLHRHLPRIPTPLRTEMGGVQARCADIAQQPELAASQVSCPQRSCG